MVKHVLWATVKRHRFLRNETNSSSLAAAAAAAASRLASLYRSKPRAKNDGCERAREREREGEGEGGNARDPHQMFSPFIKYPNCLSAAVAAIAGRRALQKMLNNRLCIQERERLDQKSRNIRVASVCTLLLLKLFALVLLRFIV